MKPTYEELVKDYINLIYFFAKRWIDKKEDIQDAVQDIYIKIFKEYDHFSFHSYNELKSWLLKVSHSVVMDRYRKQKPIFHLDVETQNNIESEQTIEKWLDLEIEKEQISQIYEKMEKLPFGDKEIIQLRLIECFPFSDIASLLNLSEAAIKMRFYRIIKSLKISLI
jgi:RNA polymerase sigma-70 factor (ECF subfamily)